MLWRDTNTGFIDDAGITQTLSEINELLLKSVLGGHNAAVCLLGGPRTGKSRCLFGSHGHHSGILPQLTEAYFQCVGGNAVGLIDIAMTQVYREQVNLDYEKGLLHICV